MPQVSLVRSVVACFAAGAALLAALPARALDAPVSLTFALPLVCFCAAPVYTADKLGYFKDEGLDVEIATVSGSAPLFAAVQQGSTPFGMTNGLNLLTTAPKGLSLVAFVAMDKGQGGFNMVVADAYAKAHGIGAKEDYRSALRKLAGARVAVLTMTGTGALLLQSQLRAQNLPDDSLKMIGMSPAASAAALAHGEIDAWWQAAAPEGGVLAFRSSTFPRISDVIGNVAFTTRDYAAKHPDVVAKVARAIARADNALLDPKVQSRALEAVYERMPDLPREEVRSEVLLTDTQARVSNGAMTVASFEATNAVGAQLGLLPRPLAGEALRALYTLQFLPKSYVKP